MDGETSAYDYLLPLLSGGLYTPSGRNISLGSTLSEKQWCAVFEEAQKQTVTGLVFDAVSSLAEHELPPVSVLARWLAKTHRIVSANAAMSEVLAELFPLFERNGLHPVLQKGHAAARFYHNPELRISGDIDLWFPGDERAAADAIARRCGYNVVATPDRGSCYMIGSIEAEHHSMLIEIHNPCRARSLRDIVSVYGSRRVELSPGLTIRVPAPMIELLMINAHILKHCLGVGIGLRQFCDYAMAWRSLTGDGGVSEDEYFELCRLLGIQRWTRVLHGFINRYLPSPSGPAVTPVGGVTDTHAVERIFRMVSEGGNFGRYNPGRRNGSPRTRWHRKISTMSAFISNRSVVRGLVPAEAFWTFTRLLVGQIH